MLKKLFAIAAIAAVAASCDKKNETGSITTETSKTSTPETTTTTTVTPVDSATTVKTTETSAVKEKATTTKTTTGTVHPYISDDGKTKFSAIFDADKGTAALKNETTGKTYEMKTVTSASGAKYQDAAGNFFWTHQNEFTFGKGEKELIHGKEAK